MVEPSDPVEISEEECVDEESQSGSVLVFASMMVSIGFVLLNGVEPGSPAKVEKKLS